MASFRSILKPDQSTLVGLGTVAAVYATYQLNVGNAAEAQATKANHPVLEASRKRAGWTSLALVSALTLITRDGNVWIFGVGSIIVMELGYRYSIMADPGSLRMQNPSPETAYMPAENVVPMPFQGQPA